MAGDWIKMRGNLWDDPRVSKLCDLTDQSEACVIGGLYWLWAMADQHTESGVLPGLTLRQIDRKTGIQGFGQALCDIGWLADHPEGARIVRFEEHNGASAKRRCSDAQRKANSRNVSAPDADNERTNLGHDSDEIRQVAELEKEKRREEEKEPDGSVVRADSAKRIPPCPRDEVVSLYHSALPELPSVRLMTEPRKRALKAFWEWVFTAKKSDGSVRAQTADQALTWIRGYFERASKNDFLMGRGPKSPGHERWECDLDFLLTDKGKKQVIERTKEAA